MFTANFADYQIRHEELIQQAQTYRLTRIVETHNDLISRIQNAFGRLLILSGRSLLTLAEVNR